MSNKYILVESSPPLCGTVNLVGAKNATLVIMTSLILTSGISTLHNVPQSADVELMIKLLCDLGAQITFDRAAHTLTVDTSTINTHAIRPEIMNKMRASILAMGPLLARFGKADVAIPGGCVIGARPIDYHIRGLARMGAQVHEQGHFLYATYDPLSAPQFKRIVLEYPSVGATENILMAATLMAGETQIINAALEPEVLDLIEVLRAMGAQIWCIAPATIIIQGVATLKPITHSIIPDRLEAGALLLAAAVSGGTIFLPDAQPDQMDVFLDKLSEMGHQIQTVYGRPGITLVATKQPRAVSFKTAPYPGFPTDLQAPMMAAQVCASGTSVIEETVFENRLMHVRELQKMGAQITLEGNRAVVHGVEELYGTEVIASDIRASCALVLAGLTAEGNTKITGIHHWKRGYDNLEQKLRGLGGSILVVE